MKRLILHIGMHKTGTTSIQEALGSSQSILKESNIYYADLNHFDILNSFYITFLDNPLDHISYKKRKIHDLEFAKVEQEYLKKLWGEEFERLKDGAFIISDEELSLLTEDNVIEMGNFLKGYFTDITVIMYAREPMSFIPSIINEYIKYGATEFVNGTLSNLPYYINRVVKYERVFGRENIIIRPFNKKSFKNGNLIDDFFDSLNISFDTKDLNEIVVNESLGKNALTILFEYNKKFPRFVNSKMNKERGLAFRAEYFFKLLQSVKDKKFTLDLKFSVEDAEKINTEIQYINSFLMDKDKFFRLEPSQEFTEMPSPDDVPLDFFLELINEYNKTIDSLIEENEKYIQIKRLEDVYSIIEQRNTEIERKNTSLKITTNELKNVQEELGQRTEELEQRTEELGQFKKELEQAQSGLAQKTKEIGRLQKELEQTREELNLTNESINKLRIVIDKMQSIVALTINQAKYLSYTKLFKLVHFMYRIKHQLIKGNAYEKKCFFEWFSKRRNKRVYINNHRYNPLFQIVDLLNQCNSASFSENNLEENNRTHINLNESPELKVNLQENYDTFDVIFLSIINYDFRYQRPQHLANAFAKNGHRVFYFNANLDRNEQINIAQTPNNLKVYNIQSSKYNTIYEMDNLADIMETCQSVEMIINENGVRDCLIVVEYPTWTEIAKFLKEKYGFKIIADYLDDYTGFKETHSNYLRNSNKELLKISDKVIASSNYLAEKAEIYNSNVKIVRNGTESEFFNKAMNKVHFDKKNKIVGYFGAIAHWFDFVKIEYIAENLPDIEVIIIGDVTEGYDRLSKYSNVKMLGEKPYKVLPNYLKDFDVCLIPFNTSTDLIKATNPVKFYEYLSAGKKVVATEIPELIPYRDKYVYLSNNNEEFLDYVKACLEGTDKLASEDELIEFAKLNDWTCRGNAFLDFSREVFPKVSIIVLTYNQLDYTKQCISSIIDKTAYPNYELIIVDNNSQDDTQEYLKQIASEHNHVKVILNEENCGFAGGNNIGLMSASGDYFILLNNDTVVTRGWITGLLKHFNNNEKLGLVGPVTNSIGNEAMIKTNYEDLEHMDSFAYNYTTKHMGDSYSDITTLAMFCVVISKKSFENVGYLDENYKVGMFEDDDYSLAMLKTGYEILCAEDVFIHHFGSASFKKLDDKKYKEIFENNKKYFEKKWDTKWMPHKYRDGIL